MLSSFMLRLSFGKAVSPSEFNDIMKLINKYVVFRSKTSNNVLFMVLRSDNEVAYMYASVIKQSVYSEKQDKWVNRYKVNVWGNVAAIIDPQQPGNGGFKLLRIIVPRLHETIDNVLLRPM